MDLNQKRIMVFGAFGQCGAAITKLILRTAAPEQLILTSLHQTEADSIAGQARQWALGFQPDSLIEITPECGNILLSDRLEQTFKRLRAGENVEAEYFDGLLRYVYREYSEFSKEDKQDIFIYRLLTRYRPHILIDCVNTATGLAYQDIYSLGKAYLERKSQGGAETAWQDGGGVPLAERLLLAPSLPSLVRHIEILSDALKASDTQLYLKVGTTGTGGMGLNIPYTHSESKPSRTLMSKSAVAGAASLLYLLMNRTAGNPIIKEIKPAALIGWKAIAYGEVKKGGVPVQLWDCPLDRGVPLGSPADAFGKVPASKLGDTLKAVYIDTGENGVFSAAEFETITSLEQMELVTPEDVARAAVEEICGESTGFDIIGALNAVCLDSSYRGGVMRGAALAQLHTLEAQHQQEGVAFEILGPPRLSKLLWEAYLLKRHGRLGELLAPVFADETNTPAQRLELFDRTFDPAALCDVVTDALADDQETRARILSIGIPICTPDLKLLFGPNVALMRAHPGLALGDVLADPLRRRSFIENGAVELLPGNFERWKGWLSTALRYHFATQADGPAAAQGSAIDQRRLFSAELDPGTGRITSVELQLGELIGLLFTVVEHGSRRRHHFPPE
jgi:hypothetical protein